MSNFTSIKKLPPRDGSLQAWALDFPQQDKAPRVTERGLYLQGWVLAHAGVERGELLARFITGGQEVLCAIPFNNDRPDVIQRVLGADPSGHPQLRCGFIAYLKEAPQAFTLGVKLDGETVWLCDVQLMESTPVATTENKRAEMQVIRGTGGWLFLDNDTNRSVDQYTGRLQLDGAGLERWQAYLDGCVAIAKDVAAPHALVIAASKEQVLPEHYPHQKGEKTVHEQVLGLCREEHRVLDTVQLLAARPNKETLFIKTDTHWTDRGALAATLALLARLGLDAKASQDSLTQDVYYTMPFIGDLGGKLSPAVSEPTEFLQAPPPASNAVFDNNLANIGRVLVFEDEHALWSHSLLVFGASSSYPMLKYLKRLFGRVVFVHSAGHVDRTIVQHEKPDFLVMQTTARFMIEPPGVGFVLASAVADKMAITTEDVRARALAARKAASANPKNLPYCDMLKIR
ncbi:alginate O-acetyltransferase AlgX-related protein [Massilia consociata]|uniref:AlgX/AlgJ SGNH hydrolase-like domain-containing protein n=1 Tax=Massilia consociata TaxID=760117 RepID=A0ABV6FIN9_9BURK